MTLDAFSDLSWLGVIVGAIGYFVLGGLWYSPLLFATPWMASIGWQPEPDHKPGLGYLLTPLVTCLLEAVAIGALAVATGSDTVGEGLVLGLVVGLVVASLFATTASFEPTKPNAARWGLITGGYHVLGAILVGVLVSVL